MNSCYVICPFCAKTVYIEENLSGGYSCPHCSQALGFKFLQENDYIIDIKSADEEYVLGEQYFLNTDFRAAGEHFAKVLKYNRNNYLAEYYTRLCAIYENENRPDYNVPAAIVEAVSSSIQKLDLSQVNVKTKIDFIYAMLNQVYIILSSHFNKIYDDYEKTEKWSELREKALNIATTVKGITLIHKEMLMAFDANIAKSLVSIVDLSICACQKVVVPHLNDDKLDLPTDEQCDEAKRLYSAFYYFATSLDKSYVFSSYKPDYTANLLFNESVSSEISRYDEANKHNKRKFLSEVKGIESLRKSCLIAIEFSYYSCFKSLQASKSDNARNALMSEAIRFSLETLLPRVSIGEDKKVRISVRRFSKAREICKYLNDFLSDYSEINRRIVAEYMNRFYKQVYEMIKLYFSLVYNSYNKFVNKLKAAQNKEFDYYRGFLYQVASSCALALTDCVSFSQHSLGDRVKLLRLGKQVTEEFLLLSDYKLDELERSTHYSDILDIFNALDLSIEQLT